MFRGPFSITEGSLCLSSFNSVITLVGTSDELFCDKVLWTILHSDLLTSIGRLSDKGFVHGGYAEETAPSSNVKDTDKE